MKQFLINSVNFPGKDSSGKRAFTPNNGSIYNMGDFAEAVANVYYGTLSTVADYTHNSTSFDVSGDINLTSGDKIQVKALHSSLANNLNGLTLTEKINDYMNRSAANIYLIMIADYDNDSFNCFELNHDEFASFLVKHTKMSGNKVRLSDSMKDLIRYGQYAI